MPVLSLPTARSRSSVRSPKTARSLHSVLYHGYGSLGRIGAVLVNGSLISAGALD